MSNFVRYTCVALAATISFSTFATGNHPEPQPKDPIMESTTKADADAKAAAKAVATGGDAAVNFWAGLSPDQRNSLISNDNFRAELAQRTSVDTAQSLLSTLSNYSPSSATSSSDLRNVLRDIGNVQLGLNIGGNKNISVSMGGLNGGIALPIHPQANPGEKLYCMREGKIEDVPLVYVVTGRAGGIYFKDSSDVERGVNSGKAPKNPLVTQRWVEKTEGASPENQETITRGQKKYTFEWGIWVSKRTVEVGNAMNGQIAAGLFAKGDGGQLSAGGGSNVQTTIDQLTPTGDACIINEARLKYWLANTIDFDNLPPTGAGKPKNEDWLTIDETKPATRAGRIITDPKAVAELCKQGKCKDRKANPGGRTVRHINCGDMTLPNADRKLCDARPPRGKSGAIAQ